VGADPGPCSSDAPRPYDGPFVHRF
jgi:hypothetical protein